jgi:hypothetical protein
MEEDETLEDNAADDQDTVELVWDNGLDSNPSNWRPMARAHRIAIEFLQQAISKSYREKKRFSALLEGHMTKAVCTQLGDLEQIVRDHGSISTALANALSLGVTNAEDMSALQGRLANFECQIQGISPEGGGPAVRIVRQLLRPVVADTPIIVISQVWLCWLSTVLALKLPMVATFVPPAFREAFHSFGVAVPWQGLEEWGELPAWPSAWDSLTVLSSGSILFVDTILSKLKGKHEGILLFALDIVARGRKVRDLKGLLGRYANELTNRGLASKVVSHADFGGATSAANVVALRGIGSNVQKPINALPCCLSYVISPTASTYNQEIEALPDLDAPPRAPIMCGAALLHPAGLWDVTRPELHIGCCSVFKRMGWVRRHLTPSKFLHAYDMPLGMDASLTDDKRARDVLVRGLLPLIVASIFRAIWAGGIGGGLGLECERLSGERTSLHMDTEEFHGLATDTFSFERVVLKCRGSPDIHHDTSLDCAAPSGSAIQATIAVSQDLIQSDTSYSPIFNKLKEEHDLAKAVKNDDAACPVYLWDEAVWAGTPSQKGLTRNKRT